MRTTVNVKVPRGGSYDNSYSRSLSLALQHRGVSLQECSRRSRRYCSAKEKNSNLPCSSRGDLAGGAKTPWGALPRKPPGTLQVGCEKQV